MSLERGTPLVVFLDLPMVSDTAPIDGAPVCRYQLASAGGDDLPVYTFVGLETALA